MAKQANGAVVVRSVTRLFSHRLYGRAGQTGSRIFPLTVDYREYTYSAGKFPGGFIKREGRMSEKETLTCR